MSDQYRSDSFLKRAEMIQDRFLGMNNLPRIEPNVKDEIYTIGHGYDERPDLLAHQIYGNSRLWWIFSLRNPDILKDPIRDFKAGKKIVLPPKSAVDAYTRAG